MIEYVILDGTQITFINGKPPTQRQKRRRLNEGENYEEQKFLQELNRRNFLVDVSKSLCTNKKKHSEQKIIATIFLRFRLVFFKATQLSILSRMLSKN